jgi:hypothetical protein
MPPTDAPSQGERIGLRRYRALAAEIDGDRGTRSVAAMLENRPSLFAATRERDHAPRHSLLPARRSHRGHFAGRVIDGFAQTAGRLQKPPSFVGTDTQSYPPGAQPKNEVPNDRIEDARYARNIEIRSHNNKRSLDQTIACSVLAASLRAAVERVSRVGA